MPIANLPFNQKLYLDIDESSTSTAISRHVNGILTPKDGGGYVSKKRPGLLDFKDVGTDRGIDGIFWWNEKSLLFIVSNGNIYKLSSTIESPVLMGGVKLKQGERVSFSLASHGVIDYLFLCNGGQIAYTDGDANVSFISDTNAPTNTTFIEFIDQYLIANDLVNDKFYYSSVGDPFTWSSLDFATAESNFDKTKTILVSNRSIKIFGENSIEFWYNDGATPFKRRNDIFVNQGTLSPYSVIKSDIGVFFFNGNREVMVLSETGGVSKVSTVIDRKLQSLSNVDDVYANNYIVGGRGLYVITFPNEELTYVYDYKNDYWSEWDYWSTLSKSRYLGNTYVYVPKWNLHLVGDYNSGKIYSTSFDYYDDAGTILKWTQQTGFIDHGSSSKKKMNIKITFRIKSGHKKTDNTDGFVMYRNNIDGNGWSDVVSIPIGKTGETMPLHSIYTQGHYYMMKHELSCSDTIDLELVDIFEEYEVLSDS